MQAADLDRFQQLLRGLMPFSQRRFTYVVDVLGRWMVPADLIPRPRLAKINSVDVVTLC